MTNRITLEGTGVDYEVFKISKETYDEWVDEESIDIDRDELGISINSTGLVIDGMMSSLCINGEPAISLGAKGEEAFTYPGKFEGYQPHYDFCFDNTLADKSDYFLIYCQVSRGSWGFVDIKEEFEPSKLDLKAERIRISSKDPDWECVVVPSSSTYEGVEFEFEGTTVRAVKWFLVNPDGEYKELE